jgi:cell division protein ZapE
MAPITAAKPVTSKYESEVAGGSFQRDPAQEALAARLDKLLVNMTAGGRDRQGIFGRLLGKTQNQEVQGLYIHGAVGRGKTILMDMFFEVSAEPRKRRAHFHAFMQEVHERVHAHRQAFKRGETTQEDPIPPVARQIAKDARLLCFDEFHVLDIADAMILSRLFKVLFDEGVVLVATSNSVPEELYWNGLNRELFLPFIKMLRDNCEIYSLDARTDYRREKLLHFAAYQTPLGKRADAAMDEAWGLATARETVAPLRLFVRGHNFDIPLASPDSARFSFDDLCAKPLGAADYLELARRYGTIFIDHVPTLDFSKRNEAKRFIIVIDVLYDSGTRLFLSAASGPDDIYRVPAGLKVGEFSRTSSRLAEMTSVAWLENWQKKRELKHGNLAATS